MVRSQRDNRCRASCAPLHAPETITWNSTAWMVENKAFLKAGSSASSVWKCDAFRHRDELADAATGERHEPDVVGERLDASSLSPDDAAAAQAFA